MEYPIEVTGIKFKERDVLEPKCLFGGECGDMVAVRPCGDEYEGKTFLGVLLGAIAISQGASFNKETGELEVYQAMHNPAIFIPDRNAVVYGCGSWWGRIEREEQLQDITDNDIENVWYVKALKQLEESA